MKSSIDNKPIKDAEVDWEDSFGNDIGSSRTDEAGNYSIVGVPPGMYDVTVYWPEGGDWLEKTSISVESGKSTC